MKLHLHVGKSTITANSNYSTKQENRTALVKMSQPRPYAEIYIKFAKRAPQRKKKDLAEFIKEPNGDFLL